MYYQLAVHISLYLYVCVLLHVACGPDVYGQDCNNTCGNCKGGKNVTILMAGVLMAELQGSKVPCVWMVSC